MIVKFGADKPQYYNGIQEKAGPRLHADTFELLKPFLNKNDHILELGCGEGAFSQRLTDAGFKVDTCDIDIQQVKAKPNKIIPLDLNIENIADNFDCKYDCVVAMEIIEHLENPWKFMRDIIHLVTDNGIVLISTPNVSKYTSRLRFFMRGNLLGFEKEDLSYGHITPITPFHLQNIFQATGYEILARKAVGELPFFEIYAITKFLLMRNIVLPFFYPFMGGEKDGLCLAFVLKKAIA